MYWQAAGNRAVGCIKLQASMFPPIVKTLNNASDNTQVLKVLYTFILLILN